MAISATIASVAGSAYSAKKQRDAQKDAERNAQKAADQAEAERERLAASTPFGSMEAGRRVASERMMARRRAASGGRGSTVLQSGLG